MIRMLKTVGFYTGIGYLNSFLSINVINPLRASPPLPDVLFDCLPRVSDLVPHAMLGLMTVYFLYRYWGNWGVLRRTYNRISLLFAMRVLTFTLTPIPPSLPGCLSREPGGSLHWDVATDLIRSRDNTCLDMMFSGHATHLVAFAIVLLPTATPHARLVILVYTVLGLLSIIASHLHYTADVLVAVFLTLLVFRR